VAPQRSSDVRAVVGRLVLAFVAALVVALALGLVVVLLIGTHGSTGFDRSVTDWFVRRHTTTWTHVMFKVSWFGTGIVVAPVALLVTIVLCGVGRARLAACFVVVVVGAPLLGTIAKTVVRRSRPHVGGSPAHPHAWSYPSGHAVEVAALWVVLGIIVVVLTRSTRLRTFVWALAAVVIVAVGVSRVYLGVHWTTDVLAGWTVGTVWAVGASWAFGWFERPVVA
jgi:membrane-associated phospholipid phosphatase